MNDYTKPCIRENNPEYVILYVGTNEPDSELTENSKITHRCRQKYSIH